MEIQSSGSEKSWESKSRVEKSIRMEIQSSGSEKSWESKSRVEKSSRKVESKSRVELWKNLKVIEPKSL